MGRQINLDEGEGKIQSASTVDSVYQPCTVLSVEFECEKQLTFDDTPDNYLTYLECDWVPERSNGYMGTSGTWNYMLTCVPRPAVATVTRDYIDTQSLASQMGLSLTVGGTPMKVKNPVINLSFLWTVREIRRQGMNDAYTEMDMSKAPFLYFNDTEMMSGTWGSLMSRTSLQLQNVNEVFAGTDMVFLVDDRVARENTSGLYATVWDEAEFIDRLLGLKLRFITASPMVFGSLYTIKFSNTDALDQEVPFLCMRVERNLLEPMGWNCLLASVDFPTK